MLMASSSKTYKSDVIKKTVLTPSITLQFIDTLLYALIAWKLKKNWVSKRYLPEKQLL